MLPLAILCGGLGTRMRPLTLNAPKPMLDVDGEPFLGHLLRSVARGGIDDVVLLIGYLGEQIVEFVGDGSAFGLRVRYVWDGDAPLGTAGAVRRALPLLGASFLVSYGDAYLHIDYGSVTRAFVASESGGLMTVYRWDGSGTTRPNTAVVANRVTRYEKDANAPDILYVDYGLSAFRAESFDGLADGERADLRVVNERLIADNDLAAYLVDHVPLEIGSTEGLAATEAFLKRR